MAAKGPPETAGPKITGLGSVVITIIIVVAIVIVVSPIVVAVIIAVVVTIIVAVVITIVVTVVILVINLVIVSFAKDAGGGGVTSIDTVFARPQYRTALGVIAGLKLCVAADGVNLNPRATHLNLYPLIALGLKVRNDAVGGRLRLRRSARCCHAKEDGDQDLAFHFVVLSLCRGAQMRPAAGKKARRARLNHSPQV
jgi:hypothetical protein